MKNYKVKLFHFDELSESAKSSVIDRERESPYSFATIAIESDAEERLDSLKGFCDAMDLEYEVRVDHDSRFIKWNFKYDNDEEMKNKGSKYLLRYLNYHYYDIRGKKYYSCNHHYDENGKFHYAHRYSKFQYTEGNCPFTGMCYDEDLLKPIFDWYKKPNWNWDIEDMIEECFCYFLSCWEKDEEYRFSDEYLADAIENNWGDKLYFEDGREFNGNEDDLEPIAA